VIVFTGIVEGVGVIETLQPGDQGVRLAVTTEMDLSDVRPGDSIAVDGCCLTAVTCTPHRFTADVSHESLARTSLGVVGAPGTSVNLERAMRLGDRMGGHWVQGHVDTVATLERVEPAGDAVNMHFAVSEELDGLIVEKGSITVDGISLTVNGTSRGSFHVTMIPHTADVTTLGSKSLGSSVNIETDIIGKYVAKQLGGQKGSD
jgi:riboflavin synthase